jgi:TonB dependent receptor/CarboxypepD_reg-like domain/TonB-dependent Receptor Plug Domain
MCKSIQNLFFILFLGVLLPINSLFSQSQIAGKLVEKGNSEAIIGATVIVNTTPNKIATTDIDGKYNIPVPPGNYTVKFSYVSFQPAQLDVVVKANETTFVDYAMEEAKSALAEVVVKSTLDRSTSSVMMLERKKATQVSDGISSDLIRKTPDRTTSDVLKRVTGATIQDGKFAIIRGMNDRYNVGYLDGALLPSTESDRKAFAFDVVPASLLDNLTVLKAGSPDLIGDFGGGIIKINTKSVPESFTQNLSIGGQYHSLTTFKDFTQFKIYDGEKVNILGNQRNIPTFDEGSLKISGVFPTKADEVRLSGISQKFNNDWANGTISALPNPRLAYSLGMPINLGKDKKMGVILALNYANTRRLSEGNVNSYDGSGQTASFNDKNYAQNISSGGLFNVNYVGLKTKINFRNLLNFNTDNNTILRTGIGNIQDAITVRNTANLLNYNRLYSGIISAKHIVGQDLFEVNASANFSSIRRKVPDYRIVSYTKSPDFDDYRMSLGDFFNSSTGRFSSDLKENIYGTNIELSKSLAGTKVKTDIKGGYFYQNRDRSFWGRNFVYAGTTPSDATFNPANDLDARNIGVGKLFLVEKTSNDLAYYEGKSSLSAGYLMADQMFSEKFRAVYGVRYEKINLSVDNQKTTDNISKINEASWLPSINATWYVSELMNIRADYFASVNRPEFRELAPFAFYVFDKNAEIRGNKDLKIAKLQNFDVRFELFPSGSQVLSIGGFYKKILNPIEQSIDITQPTTTFTYDNEKLANIYGLEFEVRKNLDFIGEAKFLKDLTIYSNLSLIKSTLEFDPGAKAKQNRPLQGQSPYIFNAGIQYDNRNSGWFGSFAANRFGRRIAYVGVDEKFGATRQDIYEAPRTVLDLQVGKNIKRFNVKLTLGDLLHKDILYYQDTNANGKYSAEDKDLLMFKYNNGFTGTFSVGYIF